MSYMRENVGKMYPDIIDDDVLDFLANIGNNFVWKIYQKMQELPGNDQTQKIIWAIQSMTIQGLVRNRLITRIGFVGLLGVMMSYTLDYAPDLKPKSRDALALAATGTMNIFAFEDDDIPEPDITREKMEENIRENYELHYFYQKIQE